LMPSGVRPVGPVDHQRGVAPRPAVVVDSELNLVLRPNRWRRPSRPGLAGGARTVSGDRQVESARLVVGHRNGEPPEVVHVDGCGAGITLGGVELAEPLVAGPDRSGGALEQ